MSMAAADLIADLKSSLGDAAAVFKAANDADFIRFLDVAALDLSRFRRRTLLGKVTLVAGQAEYDAPADMVKPKLSMWGVSALNRFNPWQNGYPGRLPRLGTSGDPQQRKLTMMPPPTSEQISSLGSRFDFYYYASHVIGDASATTVRDEDRGLLLLRAQAEAAKDLSIRNIHKAVNLRDGLSGGSLTGTPSALFRQLLDLFEQQAAV